MDIKAVQLKSGDRIELPQSIGGYARIIGVKSDIKTLIVQYTGVTDKGKNVEGSIGMGTVVKIQSRVEQKLSA